jgi:hypothetical protein
VGETQRRTGRVHIGARLGELDINTLGDTVVGDAVELGDEEGRTVGEGSVSTLGGLVDLLGLLALLLLNVTLGRAGGGNGDGGAVHVELAVTSVVDPGPGEQDLVANGSVRGHSEVELGSSGTVTLLGVDDGEGGTAIVTQRGLARASIVGSTTLNLDGLLGTLLPGSHGSTLIGVENIQSALARVCGGRVGRCDIAVDGDGIGVVLVLQRRRVIHVHVCRDRGGQGGDDKASGGGTHLES